MSISNSNNLPTAEAVRQRLRPFGIFFEKSLKDLIKGIRSHNETPESLHEFLTKELAQCRKEANSPDINLKTNAVLKLSYLEMYGFDMSWCNFHILEVMSSETLQNKRVGYLAASQSFHRDPDILVLMTNLLKKDLKYTNKDDMVKVGIALNAISTITITQSLARDIVDDLFSMLNSSHAYIRKKTVTALFKVFLQYPEALRDNFDKFTMKLQDDDISVLSATVSVICELSKQNPWPFVALSPLLYDLLLTIDNNWIIIRLLKLFTNLSQVEPKLKYKLLPKIIELMDSTMATSVLYEAVNCIVKGSMLLDDDYETATKCLECLDKFCQSQDPNLRFISCNLFYKIGIINSQFVADYDDLILKLISDVDISIRSEALELLKGIVNDDNLKLVVSTLLRQFVNEEVVVLNNNNNRRNNSKREIPILIPNSYKIKMVKTVIELCSIDNYNNISDFEWFNALLVDLSLVSQDLLEARDLLGDLIGEQLKSIMIKVPDVRNLTMMSIIKILSMDAVELRLPTVLKECIWSLGEYSSLIENGDIMIKLLIEKSTKFNIETKIILITAILKLLSTWCNGDNAQVDAVEEIINIIIEFIETLTYNSSFEIQERAIEANEFLKLIKESLDEPADNGENNNFGGLPMLLTDILPSFYNGYELRPIAQGTQTQLQQNLAQEYLETPFLNDEDWNNIMKQYNIDQDAVSDTSIDESDIDETYRDKSFHDDISSSSSDENELGSDYDVFDKDKKERKQEQLSNPFYLTDNTVKHNNEERDVFSNADGNEHVNEQMNMVKVKNSISPEIPTVEMFSHDAAATKDKKKKMHKHKTKAKKVKVLTDEVFVQPGLSEFRQNVRKSSNPSSIKVKGGNAIHLQTKSKLGNFDFSKDEINDQKAIHDDELELDKIRQKFQAQTLNQPQISSDNNGNDDNDEEVVIIKKKRKKGKGKHKKKKHSKKEDTEFLEPQHE
ncbi:AP-3 complex subunit delta [Monosporozyma unispora]|nr:AP-3 complex subunit delta [Kazachstania unispora]